MQAMIRTKTIQEADKEWGKVSADCLSVPVILRGILQHFNTKELLQLSLVNKQWNYEARSLMKNRGNVTASFNKLHKCQDLRAFASDLRRMRNITKVVPFSGMTVSVGGWMCQQSKDFCQQSPNRELEPIYEEILGGLTWKHFSIQHGLCWEEHKSCPGFILQKKIFRKLDSVLEELSIQLGCNEVESFKKEFLQDCFFTRLKTFRLTNEFVSSISESSDLIKTLLAIAPNLQVLHTSIWVDLSANLLEGSSAVHVTDHSYSPSLDQIPESVAGQLQMTKITLSNISSDFNLERYNRITSTLLQQSRTTLTFMEIDAVFLVHLMTYGICLQNVRRLDIFFDHGKLQDLQPSVLRLFKYFDFTRVFPKLKHVELLCSSELDYKSDVIDQIVEQGNAAFIEPAPGQSVDIEYLHLEFSTPISNSAARLLTEMFPDIRYLSIYGPEIPFDLIWRRWLKLESLLVIELHMTSVAPNLESGFCGVFPEEIAELRQKDDEYLRRVNIVPVKPSITCLRGLRNLEFHFAELPMELANDPTLTFSKVTGLIAFQRCPNLVVTLKANSSRLEGSSRLEALNQLKPYASVILSK